MEPTETIETMSYIATARSFIIQQQVRLEGKVEDNLGAAGTKELLKLSLFAVCLAMVCAILALMDLLESLYEVGETVRTSERAESLKAHVVHYYDEAVIYVQEWYESIGTSVEEVEIPETESQSENNSGVDL